MTWLRITSLSHQSGNNTQIAAPQRATNQASESQTSTSSRFMVGSARWCWFSREVRYSAALMPLPERPHPVLLLRANDLGVRAKWCAPVKTAAHFFGASLNCDISPDWRTPRALSLRRDAKHVADGFGVPLPHAFRVCGGRAHRKRRAMVVPPGRQIPCSALLDANQYRASALRSI